MGGYAFEVCNRDAFVPFCFNPCRQKSAPGQSGVKVPRVEDIMHLAVVACGNRLEETLTMVKSALLFSIKKIKFHIFAEEELAKPFEKEVRVHLKVSFLSLSSKSMWVFFFFLTF